MTTLNKSVSKEDLRFLMGFTLFFLAIYVFIFDDKIFLGGDNINYYLLGKAIRSGLGYVNLAGPNLPPVTHYPPGYPFLLSIFMFISEDLVFLKALMGVFAWACLMLSYFLFRNLSQNANLAAFSILFLLINYHFLSYSTILMTEVPFMLLSVLTVLFLVNPRFKKPPVYDIDFYILSFCAVATFYVRSFGLILIVSIPIFFWMIRKRYHAMFSLLFSLLLISPWFIRNSLSAPGLGYVSQLFSADPYLENGSIAGLQDLATRVASNIDRYVGKEVPATICSFLEMNYNTPSPWYYYGIGLVLLALTFWGVLRISKGKYFFLPLFVSSFVILLLWPSKWYGVRFIVSILPFLTFFMVYGCYSLLVSASKYLVFLKGRELVAVGFFGSILLLHSMGGIGKLRANSLEDYPANFRSYANIALWVKDNISDSSVIAARKPSLFYLYSQRKTVRFQDNPNEEELIRNLINNSVDYVVLDNLGYRSSKKFMLPAMKKYPLKFEQVFKQGDPVAACFRFRQDLGYWGQWKDGQKHGFGTFTFSNRTVYQGGWKNDKMHGKGILKTESGIMIRGIWKEGNLIN